MYFQSDYAEILGLKLTRGVPIQVTPAGGGTIDAYGHTVIMEVLDQRVESVVYFTDHSGFRRNVLGRQGVAASFQIRTDPLRVQALPGIAPNAKPLAVATGLLEW